MRWRYRRARIDAELRRTFERYGVGTMQALLAAHDRPFIHGGKPTNSDAHLDDLLAWLTEQYERMDTKETWSLTMEVLIALLIIVELWLMFFPRSH